MPEDNNLNAELMEFERLFDSSHEDRAVECRELFIKAFPLKRLRDLTVDDYVIGKGTDSFCAYVEPKTKAWANIQGATASKFGIYFGKTKSAPKKQYRFTRKFGANKSEAFQEVKVALLDLVKAGKSKNFSAIDSNGLSQMFKAKILSLYFPDNYINVCSSEHLELFASKLGIPEKSYSSEYQHLLTEWKRGNSITKKWSNPKFMYYLYSKYLPEKLKTTISRKLKKPTRKAHHKVNFEDILDTRSVIGKKSEEFALQWEKNRLIELGYPELASQIIDRRNIPTYGYDFMSHNHHGHERYIEVKSVGKDKADGGFRFYLSENEHSVSNSKEHTQEYYFYLVLYGSDGNPRDLLARRASELYASGELRPCAYVVRFEIEGPNA